MPQLQGILVMKINKPCAACALIFAAVSFFSECRAQAPPANSSANSTARTPTPSAETTPAMFPIVPLLIQYDYSPVYFMQPLKDIPEYLTIEATIYNSKPLDLLVTLLDKESKRPVLYCNADSRAKTLSHSGREAHLVPISLKIDRSPDRPASYEFAFTDSRGQAIVWRFVLASEPSERGVGLTPLPKVPGLKLSYRGNGTTAGEGTAVQIGSRVSEAEAWPEISAPPYFVAYHGFYTESLDSGSLVLGTESWRITSAPKDLKPGSTWTVSGERSGESKFEVVSHHDDELTIREKNDESSSMDLVVKTGPQGWMLRSISVMIATRSFRMSFVPELPLTANAAESSFTIGEGKQEKVAQGTVSLLRNGSGLQFRWQFTSPDWAKARTLTSILDLKPDGYTIEVK
jgi:hypothetical protein